MAKLTRKTRNNLPSSDFAEPKDRKYPVNDKGHARAALSRVAQHGNPAEKKAVKKKVHAKFPGIKVSNSKGGNDKRHWSQKKTKKRSTSKRSH
jgi:hypothetical protein